MIQINEVSKTVQAIGVACVLTACTSGTAFRTVSITSSTTPLTNSEKVHQIENLNVRYCSPGTGPAVLSADPSFAAREMVLRISKTQGASENTKLLSGTILKASESRSIIFESPVISMDESSRYSQLTTNSFFTDVPGSAFAALAAPNSEGYVVTLEERVSRDVPVPGPFGVGTEMVQGYLIFGSSMGSKFPNPVPPQQPNSVSGSSADKVAFQMTIVYKSGFNNSENTREQGCDEIVDPLVIDFAGTGVKTTSDFVDFDISNSGTATRMGWLAANSGQAFLIIDSNGNGTVDSGAEMFSNYMPIDGGYAANGFEALKQFDHHSLGGNSDGVIDSADSVFSNLLLWFDQNGDGQTDRGELVTLQRMGVSSFSLDYNVERVIDSNGNQTLGESAVRLISGRTCKAYDVWFQSAE